MLEHNVTNELDILAWAALNWKTVASFVALVLWIGKKHWDQVAHLKSYEKFIEDYEADETKREDKELKINETIRQFDKELDRLKTSVTVDREYSAKSLDEFNSRLSTLMDKLIKGL